MFWDDRRQLRASDPSPDGLDRRHPSRRRHGDLDPRAHDGDVGGGDEAFRRRRRRRWSSPTATSTGVVDWSNARLVARGFDVALMRCDLAIEPGRDWLARFLAAYEEASGVRIEHLGLWDELAATRALEEGHEWVESWIEIGIPMTADQIRTRAEAFRQHAGG